MLWFTDAVTQKQIAVNPKYVVAVFTAQEGEATGKTVISLINGTCIVEDSELEVVGRIGNGEH